MNNISFSAYYTDKLGEEIKNRALEFFPNGYEMSFLVGSKDLDCITNAWNKGIDAYLEGVTEKSSYHFRNRTRVIINIHPEELHVLVRRLLEDDDENANSLASDICTTLGIELV
jgi:hypothetical protein